MTIEYIGLGGGCHWCTEAVFQSLSGVKKVTQGWIKSVPPHDSFSEAVNLEFDPSDIPLAVLLEVHLRTHASQSAHSMRQKYRSAIYTHSEPQSRACQMVLQELQTGFPKSLITEILPFSEFSASPPHYQDYYHQNPERPFCKTYIDPKLALLRQKYTSYIKA